VDSCTVSEELNGVLGQMKTCSGEVLSKALAMRPVKGGLSKNPCRVT